MYLYVYVVVSVFVSVNWGNFEFLATVVLCSILLS